MNTSNFKEKAKRMYYPMARNIREAVEAGAVQSQFTIDGYSVHGFGVSTDPKSPGVFALQHSGWGMTVVGRLVSKDSMQWEGIFHDWQWGGTEDRYPDGEIFDNLNEALASPNYCDPHDKCPFNKGRGIAQVVTLAV